VATKNAEEFDGGAVTNGPERDNSAVKVRGWAPLPHASGRECAKALGRAGFGLVLDDADHVAVTRGNITVARIPLVDRIRPELLVAILRTVGITPEQFVEHLCTDWQASG
jgi:hypothetical protein